MADPNSGADDWTTPPDAAVPVAAAPTDNGQNDWVSPDGKPDDWTVEQPSLRQQVADSFAPEQQKLAKAAEGFRAGFGEEPLGLSNENIAKYPVFHRMWNPVLAPLDAAFRLPGGLIGAAQGYLGEAYRQSGAEDYLPPEMSAPRLTRDIGVLGNVGMAEAMLRDPAHTITRNIKPPVVKGADIAQFLADAEATNPTAQRRAAAKGEAMDVATGRNANLDVPRLPAPDDWAAPAGEAVAPEPPPRSPAPARPAPAIDDNTAALRSFGYTDEQIAAMAPDQVAREVATIKEGQEPTATPDQIVVDNNLNGGSPPTAPAPQPHGAAALGDMLADPRSADEIRADLAARDAALTKQPVLPSGTRVRLKNGGIEVELTGVGSMERGLDGGQYPQYTAVNPAEPKTPLSVNAAQFEPLPKPGSREAPVAIDTPADVHIGAERTADPTPAQAEAGNYRKRHIEWNGLDGAIETEAGQERTGIGADGKPWSTTLEHPYGYFKRTTGKDGDELDFYLGPHPDSPKAYVVDQIDPDNLKFDEHKIIIGARSPEEADAIYQSGFSDGTGAMSGASITEMSPAELKTWIENGDTKKPLAYQNPKTARAAPQRGPLSLFQFLAQNGGIKDHGGELRAMDLHKAFVPGFGRLVRENGRPLDVAREAAVEAGYLEDSGRHSGGESTSTINDLLDALSNEAHGRKHYSSHDIEELARRGEAAQAKDAKAQLERAKDDIRDIADTEGFNVTDDQVERAAQLHLDNRTDLIDALVDILERDAIADEHDLTQTSQSQGAANAEAQPTGADARGAEPPPPVQPAGPADQAQAGSPPARVESGEGQRSGSPPPQERIGFTPTQLKALLDDELEQVIGMWHRVRGKPSPDASQHYLDTTQRMRKQLDELGVLRLQSEQAVRDALFDRRLAKETVQPTRSETVETEAARPALPPPVTRDTAPPEAKPDLLTADRATWEKAIWEAMNRGWTNGRLDPKYKGSYRFTDSGHIQQYHGTKKGVQQWFSLKSFELGPIAQQLGLPNDFDRTKAGAENRTPKDIESAAEENAKRAARDAEDTPEAADVEDIEWVHNTGERSEFLYAFRHLSNGEPVESKYTADKLLERGLVTKIGKGKAATLEMTKRGRQTFAQLEAADKAAREKREAERTALENEIKALAERKPDESDADYYRRLLDVHYNGPDEGNGAISHTIVGEKLAELAGEREYHSIPVDKSTKFRQLAISLMETPLGWSKGEDWSIPTQGHFSSASVWPDRHTEGLNDDGYYPSRIDALHAAIERLVRSFESVANSTDSVTPENAKRGAKRAIVQVREWAQKQGGKKAPAPIEAKASTTPETPSEVKSAPDVVLARRLLQIYLDRGVPITAKALQAEGQIAYGGTLAEGKFDRKDAQDALELAVNMHIKANADLRIDGGLRNTEGAPGRAVIERLGDLQEKLPTQRVRSEEQQSFQQFSTPPAYAAAAAYAAKLRDGDVMLEPSAGTGSLVAAASKPGVKIIANELSPRRTALLRELIGNRAQVFTENAEQIDNILDVKPSVVLMNPPFSQTAGRMGDRKVIETAAVHIEAALNMLVPGGRLVAIVGRGMTMGSPAFRKWWDKIGEKNTIRANIGVDGSVFEKYGTTFGTRVIVIDKVQPAAGHKPVLVDAQTVDDLMRALEPIRNVRPEAQAAHAPAEQHAGEQGGADLAQGAEGQALSQPSATGGAGPRGRGDGGLAGQGHGGTTRAGEQPVRVEGGKRDDVAAVEPERPGSQRAGNEPVSRPASGSEPATGGSRGAQRDLQPPAKSEPGAATGSERVELEQHDPGTQGSTDGISESLYQTYEPARVRVKGAKPHPGPLVESASMSSVEPPAPNYTPHIPKKVIDKGLLSLAQLEPVIYAGRAHSGMLPAGDGEVSKRRGFFIGDGCVAAGTRIYDPITRKHRAIETLVGQSHFVLALTPQGFRPALALITFLKGEADLYRVALEDGRKITVTGQHRFLTPNGWRKIDDGLTVGDWLASADTQDTNFAPTRAACAPRGWRTPEDCLDDCSSDCGACDALPQLATDTVRASARPSRNNFAPSGSRARALTSTEAVATRAQSSAAIRQDVLQFASATVWPRDADDGVRPHSRAHASDLSRSAIEASDQICEEDTILSAASRQTAPPIRRSKRHADKRAGRPAAFQEEHYCASSAWRRIVSLEFVGHDKFYDMYVPGPENYVAEGFVNHNTGVGKGREIAGIILDNWGQGRTKAIWVSEKQKLLNDAKRDWSGLEQNPNMIFNAGKVKTGEPIQAEKGIGFITYDTLKGGMSDQAAIARGGFVRKQPVSVNGQSGTVSRVTPGNSKRPAQIAVKLDNGTEVTVPANEVTAGEAMVVKSRVDQLVDWFGKDFDGVVAFDESHNMGNASATKGERGDKDAAQKALAGLELQKRLPNARVVYVSATGATEVSNLAYADRLGLWGRGTPFASQAKFTEEVEKGGIAAMELIARDMKQLGLYTARNLSYDGVEYNRVEHVLDANQREIYDTLAEAWQNVLRNINAALEETGGNKDGKAKSAVMSAFWGGHQRFFNQIITSLQMPSVIKNVEADLAAGRQAVLQLTNTNEASQERAAAKATTAEEIEDLDITPRDQIIPLVEKSFPTQEYEQYVDENGKERSRPVVDSDGNPVQNKQAVAMREALIDKLASVRVPQGPLDMVLDHFGVENVSEVTGRGRRFVLKPDEKTGQRKRVEESRPGSANQAEIDGFQAGKKKVLVFSEAGGTGASYHADNTSASKDARRSHYLVQGGWRADKAVQGFGRTHRTNQASAPIVRLVTTDLQGQKRFISSIARRLAQLGALTKGQRQAGDQGIFSARDNLESHEAHLALRQFYNDLLHDAMPGIRIDEFEKQTGLQLRIQDDEGRVTGAKENLPPITQFLNRLLSLKIDMQNLVFNAFSERLDRVIEAREAAGLLDVGLETVKADKIVKDTERTVHTVEESKAETKHVKFTVSDKFEPLDFKTVADNTKRPIKFYVKSSKDRVYAVAEASSLTNEKGHIVDYYRLINPVSGSHVVERVKVDNGKDWSRIDRGRAQEMWAHETSKAPEYLSHDLHLITGAILPIWDRLGGSTRVVRLQTDSGERYIGRVVPKSALVATLKKLGAEGEAQTWTPDKLYTALMDGGRATLTNGWTLSRRLVAGEHRIELKGPSNFSEGNEVKADGVFTERINYELRYFVPTDEAAGAEVLGKLTKYRTVVDMAEGGGKPAGMAAGDDDGPMFAMRRAEPEFGDEPSLLNSNPGITKFSDGELRTPFTPEFQEHGAQVAPLLRAELDRLGLHDIALNLPDRINIWAEGQHASADGVYWNEAITLALASDSKFKTLQHEALHAMRKLGLFTDAEWNLLTGRSRAAWRKQFEIDQFYEGRSEDVKDEEGIAHAYAEWADKGLKVDSRLARLFKRIRDFLEALGNALRGAGFKTVESIFRDVKSGKVGERAQTAAKGKTFDEWQRKGGEVTRQTARFAASKKGPEKVISAAVQHEGRIFTGILHSDAWESALKAIPVKGMSVEAAQDGSYANGFLTNRGRYVDLQEAMEIAREQDQAYHPDESSQLASENLKPWDDTDVDHNNAIMDRVLGAKPATKEFLSVDGKPAWAIVVDPIDNAVLHTVGYAKAADGNFHHNHYLPPNLARKVSDGKAVIVWGDAKGLHSMEPMKPAMRAALDQYYEKPSLAVRREFPTETGADGKPQTVIPGAERITDRERAQRGADQPLKPGKAQKPADQGLFGEPDTQLPLFAMKRPDIAPDADLSVRDRIAAVFDSKIARKLTEGAQDLSHPVKLLQRELEMRRDSEIPELSNSGEPIESTTPDAADFYTKKRLFPGRVAVEVQDFNKAHLDPLIETMRTGKVTLEQAGDYAYAKHVEERNAKLADLYPPDHDFNLAKLDDTITGASGRSTAWANDVLNKAKADGTDHVLEKVSQQLAGIKEFILDKMKGYGLETPAQIKAWREQYENYVPLSGWEDRPEEAPPQYREGRKFNVRGKEVKRAFGRSSKADNPIVNIIDQAYRTLDRGERNVYLQSLAIHLGSFDPKDIRDIVQFNHGAPKKIIDRETGFVRLVDDSSYRYKPEAVAYKVGGNVRYMVFKDRALAEAIKRMSPDELGMLQPLLTLQNKIKALWTHYSPDFLVRHFLFRYPIEGTLNAFEQKGQGDRTAKISEYVKDAVPFLGKATRAIFARQKGEAAGEMGRYWDEMRKQGGAMTFRSMRDTDLLREHLGMQLKSLSRRPLATMAQKARAAVEAMDYVTNTLDNSLRLAAYAQARKSGKTPQQAALIAREATVDFQLKGRFSNMIGLWFPFGNVAIQTGARMTKAVVRSRIMSRVFMGTMLAGFLIAMFNYLVGGDDKDGVPFFEKIPEWDRRLNFIILNPFDKDAKGRPQPIKIPMPYNWAFPLVLGYAMGNRVFGKEKLSKTAAMVATLGLEVLTPFGQEHNKVAMMTPELARPFVHVMTNKDWAGRPIHSNESFQKGPNSESKRRNTGEGWHYMSSYVNRLSGGSRTKSGVLDFYPEDYREIFNYVGGTQSRLAQNLYESGKSIGKGEAPDATKIPLARVIHGTDYDAADRAAKFERLDKMRHPWKH